MLTTAVLRVAVRGSDARHNLDRIQLLRRWEDEKIINRETIGLLNLKEEGGIGSLGGKEKKDCDGKEEEKVESFCGLRLKMLPLAARYYGREAAKAYWSLLARLARDLDVSGYFG